MLIASSSPPRFHPDLMKQPRELAHLFTAWSGTVPAGGIMAEEKRDGIRALYIDGRLLTREGNEIHGVRHILPTLRLMEEKAGHALFIDAEFQIGDSLRHTISHLKRGSAAPDAGTLWAFDCMPADQWRSSSCEEPLYRCKAILHRLWATAIEEMQSDPWTSPQGSCGRCAAVEAVVVVPDVWLADADAVWGGGEAGVGAQRRGISPEDMEQHLSAAANQRLAKRKEPGP